MTAAGNQRNSSPVPACGFEVSVHDDQTAVDVRSEWLAQIAEQVLRTESVASAQLSIALVDDATIHHVNRQFLQHDYATDVISFLLDSGDIRDGSAADGRWIEGEIVISGETAARSAKEIGCPAGQELALYLVHGLLHLCGYDDQTPADQARMRDREKSHLKKCGFATHYES